jgi:hypothetical protein
MLKYMEKSTLATYVAEKLRSSLRADDIKQQLLLVGWSEEEVGEALVKGLVASGVPAPQRVSGGSGRLASTVEVILSLFSFILLSGVASALTVLYYQVINYYFPDALQVGYGYADVSTSAIHYAIAALIVGFPIYVLTLSIWFRRYREDEAKVESNLTKWLTYVVLLIAAVTIVGDLVTALFYFLQGEVTVRFFLKALTILVVFGVIFGFYYLERQKIQYKKNISRKTFSIFKYAVAGLVLMAIILGFIAGGSPQTERKRGFDETRAQDLSTLASCIGTYSSEHKALPATLGTLTENTQYSYCSDRKDPETGSEYTYNIITPSEKTGDVTQAKFELCANYALETTKESIAQNSYSVPDNKWGIHPVGNSCDTEVVTLDRIVQNNFAVPVPVGK